MKKIRINELARELEVKPGVILDLLPGLGVQEKKTHSSSVDEDVAIELRNRLTGSEAALRLRSEYSNGFSHEHDEELDSDNIESEDESAHDAAASTDNPGLGDREAAAVPASLIEAPKTTTPAQPTSTPESVGRSSGISIPKPDVIKAGSPTHSVPSLPIPPSAPRLPILPARPRQAESAVPGGTEVAGNAIEGASEQAGLTHAAPAMPAEPERPIPRFQPLRPPMGGGLHPPLAPAGGGPGTPLRNVPIAARPVPPATVRPGAPSQSVPLSGPRQPLPPEPGKAAPTFVRPPDAVTAKPADIKSAEPSRPPLGIPQRPVRSGPLSPAAPSQPSSRPSAPSQLGPSQPSPSQPAPSTQFVPPTATQPVGQLPTIASAPPSSMPSAPRAPIARPQSTSGVSASGTPSAQPPSQIPPTHVIVPGAAGAPPPASAGSVPGTPMPFRPAPPPQRPSPPAMRPSAPTTPGQAPSLPQRPTGPRPPGPGLVPNTPIAPRPQGARPASLAGQPAARPIVPPRPDLVARLQQTRPGLAAPPASPRPGAPARPSTPAPGQPIYRGPIRPGQPPMMRGPGGPPGPGGPSQQAFGQRRPGQRPMHPTTPLRAEPATVPTEQQRRHQAKPGARQGPRKREEREEGIIRERVNKRQAIYEPPPIDREITVAEGVTVGELSEKLGVKANMVMGKLMGRKIFATINQTLDTKLAEEIAREFGASTNKVSYEEESTQDLGLVEETKDQVRRAPVVTIMGHVDHGKTSLLDAIRESNVAGREAGGITQHIGAYRIEKNDRKIVFIDTPGHQAFTRMRARGAKITDIVVLVVSADDGVMPQTLEAIDHAKAAGVPMLVAINKIDKPDAQPDRVKQQLADRGLLAEDWGGDVVMVPVSAKKHLNLDLLLEMILLVADIQDLKANPARPALGTVLEAQLDRGRGPVATMLVRNGTLRVGDFFICGALFSKVRAMFDDRGNAVKEAEPSMPVEVIGLESLPEVGDSFQVVSDTSKAKQIVIYREAKAREIAMAKGARVATLDSLHKQFEEGDLKDLNVIIKADVGGTAEVLSDSLQQLSNDKIRVRVLHAGVGAITETDVLLASASEAIIIGFNVKPERNAQATADQQKVEIRQHSIIYELIDEIKLAMSGLLDPVYKEIIQGHAEVKETFKISKIGTIAGCYVADGLVRRDSQIRVMRGREVIHTGRVDALKRFKNDASEVKNGIECGISLVNFNNIETGDVLEAFTMERVPVELPVPSSNR